MPFSAQDLLLAQEVQSAAIPSSSPILIGMEIATRATSAQALGGDFHLILRSPGESDLPQRLDLVVGDVSGKGLPASLISTSIGHLLPLLHTQQDSGRALRTLNQALLERTPLESYATLVLAEADTRTGWLRLWSAGHPPALLLRAATGLVEIAATGNPPLGCFSNWRGEPQDWVWNMNDVLVLYTDGLTETRKPSGQMFTIERVREVLRRQEGRNTEEIADALMEAVHIWGAVTDDITILVCRRTIVAPSPRATSSPVRVLLVDDHCIWRDGMRSLLSQTEFTVVGEAESGNTALEAVQHTKPDLVLLDIRMADGDGLEALRTIRERMPKIKVVIVTTYDHPHYKVRALADGAAGYLLKGMPREEMLANLRTALNNETAPETKALVSANQDITDATETIAADDLTTPLTNREEEVLALLSTGMGNYDIGERLFISEGTVKTHVGHIISKLGVADRVQAAVWAARHGIAPKISLPGAG